MQDDTICGAKTRSGKPCQNAPMKNGRCRMHGGKSLSGVDSPTFKHGRYSKHIPASINTKASDFNQGDILDLSSELSMQRAFLAEYLSRFKDVGKPTLGEFNIMMGWLGDISKTVERIVKLQNETALTGAEIQYLRTRAVQVIAEYIDDTNKRKRFIRDLFGIPAEQPTLTE